MTSVIQICQYLPQYLRETTVIRMPQGRGDHAAVYVTTTVTPSDYQLLFPEFWFCVAKTAT